MERKNGLKMRILNKRMTQNYNLHKKQETNCIINKSERLEKVNANTTKLEWMLLGGRAKYIQVPRGSNFP